jgi:hypothetical protein
MGLSICRSEAVKVSCECRWLGTVGVTKAEFAESDTVLAELFEFEWDTVGLTCVNDGSLDWCHLALA